MSKRICWFTREFAHNVGAPPVAAYLGDAGAPEAIAWRGRAERAGLTEDAVETVRLEFRSLRDAVTTLRAAGINVDWEWAGDMLASGEAACAVDAAASAASNWAAARAALGAPVDAPQGQESHVPIDTVVRLVREAMTA